MDQWFTGLRQLDGSLMAAISQKKPRACLLIEDSREDSFMWHDKRENVHNMLTCCLIQQVINKLEEFLFTQSLKVWIIYLCKSKLVT